MGISEKKRSENLILIRNFDPQHPIRITALRPLIQLVLKDLGQENLILSLVFVSDAQIRRLNRQYLKHSWATDVLAFPITGASVSYPGKKMIGEVIISANRARVQSKRFKMTAQEELMRYVCHGILHLLGHRDHSMAEKNLMRFQENRLLRLIGSDVKRIF